VRAVSECLATACTGLPCDEEKLPLERSCGNLNVVEDLEEISLSGKVDCGEIATQSGLLCNFSCFVFIALPVN
jgi:hypothetical protein